MRSGHLPFTERTRALTRVLAAAQRAGAVRSRPTASSLAAPVPAPARNEQIDLGRWPHTPPIDGGGPAPAEPPQRPCPARRPRGARVGGVSVPILVRSSQVEEHTIIALLSGAMASRMGPEARERLRKRGAPRRLRRLHMLKRG